MLWPIHFVRPFHLAPDDALACLDGKFKWEIRDYVQDSHYSGHWFVLCCPTHQTHTPPHTHKYIELKGDIPLRVSMLLLTNVAGVATRSISSLC